MRHPDPYNEVIGLEYFENHTDFAKYVWQELETVKDKCSSWWVDKPAFMKYPLLWGNGYRAKKAMKNKHHIKEDLERINAGRKGWQEEAIHSRLRIKKLESEKEALILQYTSMMEERDHYAGLAKTNADAAIKVNWENGELKAKIAALQLKKK